MKKILFTLFGLLLLHTEALAALPVVDMGAIKQAIMQYQEMKRQYDMLKKQYDELMALKNSVTGSYGMSLLMNGVEDAASRRPLPKTWQDVVELQKEGFYGNRLDHYAKLLPGIATKFLSSNDQDRDVVGYKMAKDHTQAAFAATEAVYDQLQKRLTTIEGLVSQIDKTQNVKEAMDLNSRIVAESGFVSLDLARLNSTQLSLQAILQNDSNRELENHTEFFSQPKQSN